MLNCPMCKKVVPSASRQCPRCSADLSLLVDFVSQVGGGLARAEQLTRQGQLGEAIWAYLAVLDVDPDNNVARRQVGQVVTAVRQFDQVAPSRRWLSRLQRQARFRHWLAGWQSRGPWLLAGLAVLLLALLAGSFYLGYSWGMQTRP
jgi:hypothetical protein